MQISSMVLLSVVRFYAMPWLVKSEPEALEPGVKVRLRSSGHQNLLPTRGDPLIELSQFSVDDFEAAG